ncbi:hypothetical protein ABZP36_018091 [Zizania latifolia]
MLSPSPRLRPFSSTRQWRGRRSAGGLRRERRDHRPRPPGGAFPSRLSRSIRVFPRHPRLCCSHAALVSPVHRPPSTTLWSPPFLPAATWLHQRWALNFLFFCSAPPLKHEDYEEEEAQAAETTEPFSPCSSPGDNAHDGQECLIDIADDFSALDGQVGERLNDMVPIPHVPKTNGEIPSVDEAFSDHQRLANRCIALELVLYDLVELKVKGDGNCQFRALSDQFYRTTEHHRFVRQQIVKQLESYPEIYAGYVPMDYREYLKKMINNGEWGDHVTLQAAADSYGVKIFILTSFRDTCYIEILPVIQKSERVICLSFWAEVHYNSIYPEGELPALEKKKKRWWHL